MVLQMTRKIYKLTEWFIVLISSEVYNLHLLLQRNLKCNSKSTEKVRHFLNVDLSFIFFLQFHED